MCILRIMPMGNDFVVRVNEVNASIKQSKIKLTEIDNYNRDTLLL